MCALFCVCDQHQVCRETSTELQARTNAIRNYEQTFVNQVF
jgi:hypothetical protein